MLLVMSVLQMNHMVYTTTAVLTWNAGVSLGPSLPPGSDYWHKPASSFPLSGPQLAYS